MMILVAPKPSFPLIEYAESFATKSLPLLTYWRLGILIYLVKMRG